MNKQEINVTIKSESNKSIPTSDLSGYNNVLRAWLNLNYYIKSGFILSGIPK